MRKLAVRLILASNTVKRSAYVLLFVVNGFHLMIHGTPMDAGMLDAMITNVNSWLLTVATS